ncbi:vesicle-fusing ATPase 1-like isoform X1 [Hyalella azteca]|uniref:Vesicle-fusing ATPase n=2 Tax=Hyalella azteca TaxID=294128 RepID=A0A8B7N760_HYAAZ|nr:vesicle-fusing ATPase 1-like isoform X1 [Hyalella azteca]XP_047735477.1 vesicle-fusing ATPase 1-like isoform X1 [Hyalella azteca]
MKVAKCPSEDLSLTNCVIVNEADFSKKVKYVCITTPDRRPLIYTVLHNGAVKPGYVGFNVIQRKQILVELDQEINVEAFTPDPQRQLISTLVLEADFLQKKSTTNEPYNTDQMAVNFLEQFPRHGYHIGQPLVFKFLDKKTLSIRVKEMEAADMDAMASGKKSEPRKLDFGVLNPNSSIIFEKAEGSALFLTGKAKARQSHTSLFAADWDFQKMGIGGLDEQFVQILRRAFASRVFPPEVVDTMGIKHVKGILLYGPPGTGKTLMARQIGKMLNAREPKIVNGPEILDKYVGESEANVRRLFAEAEEEEKRMGPNSGLHIIIFDEIDAICKQRGSVAGNTGVNDTVVNQLLSKIDGVEQLNNILVIGMTNRKDMMDEALMRPGRLEIQVEISLPNEKGRFDILKIKTNKMATHGKLDPDVDIAELAALTKNFSGAELEGLVKAASSSALKRYIHLGNQIKVDPDAIDKLKVTRADFIYSLENDVKPSLGTSDEALNEFIERGIISWGHTRDLLERGLMFVKQARSPETSNRLCLLLEGAPTAGTSALAAYLAKNSDFPFVKVITSSEMVGYTESSKCLRIKKMFDDAYRSELSCIFMNDLEQLMGYSPIGPRYQSIVLDAMYSLLSSSPPKGRKLLVICTSKRREVLEELGLLPMFTAVLRVPYIREVEDVRMVLEESQAMSSAEVDEVCRHITHGEVFVGVKKLLGLLDTMRVMKDVDTQERVAAFCNLLEDEGVYKPSA